MAIVTRRYKFSNPSTEALTRIVGHSAALSASWPLTVIDIDVDDAVAGATDTLDEFMASMGCVFDAAAPAQYPVTSFLDRTTSYTITVSDYFVRFNGASLTATLPTTPANGKTIKLKNIHSSALTVAAGGADTTDVTSIPQNQVKTLMYDSANTNWVDISDNVEGLAINPGAVTASGAIESTVQIIYPDGAVGAPGLKNANVVAGIYRSAGSALRFTVDGGQELGLASNEAAFTSQFRPQASQRWARVGTAVDKTVGSDEAIIVGVTDTSVARTITLPAVVDGLQVWVKDESGGAGTNNITIATPGAETIDGAASIAISTNYGIARVYSDGTNWFTI